MRAHHEGAEADTQTCCAAAHAMASAPLPPQQRLDPGPLSPEGLMQQQPITPCWACTTMVQVPLDPAHDSQPAAMFKCGWCGAVNSLVQQPHQQHWAAALAGVQQERRRATVLQKLWRGVRGLVVVFVVVLIGNIATFGAVGLLPRICTTWATLGPNLALAGLLLVQTLANYLAAVMRPAGSVAEFVAAHEARRQQQQPGGGAYVGQGSYEAWAWCRRCQAPKPPRCHHCRSCGVCVVDMDHHCPFLSQCVGSGNLRPFLLFLVWALAGACYILVMVSLLLAANMADVRAAVHASRGRYGGSSSWGSGGSGDGGFSFGSGAGGSATSGHAGSSSSDAVLFISTGVFWFLLQAAPWWLLGAFYLVAVAAGVLIALGMLLGSQLWYLGHGVTYIDALQQQAGGGEQQQAQVARPGRLQQASLAWRRLWEVLECRGHPWWHALLVPGCCPRHSDVAGKKAS